MILKVPYYKQDTGYTCGPTCLQMVFKFLGKFKSEAKLSKEVNAEPREGTYRRQMAREVQKIGFNHIVKSNSSLSKIKYFIESGSPVIVYYIEPADDVEHYAVIVGFKNNMIIMNDPWNGKNFKINEKEFLSRWHNRKNTSKRWMMVVTNK
jgi:ATP-binding cassette subfamily B protein